MSYLYPINADGASVIDTLHDAVEKILETYRDVE